MTQFERHETGYLGSDRPGCGCIQKQTTSATSQNILERNSHLLAYGPADLPPSIGKLGRQGLIEIGIGFDVKTISKSDLPG